MTTGSSQQNHVPPPADARGVWYVAGQFALFALIAFGPRNVHWLPDWTPCWITVGSVAGTMLFCAGGLFALAACLKHGRYFTPFIRPKEGSGLLEHGPYRIVRHPIYTGLLLMGAGWGLFVHGWLTLGYTALLFIVLDMKARREERWLELQFPDYAAYRKRVRRFFPFLY